VNRPARFPANNGNLREILYGHHSCRAAPKSQGFDTFVSPSAGRLATGSPCTWYITVATSPCTPVIRSTCTPSLQTFLVFGALEAVWRPLCGRRGVVAACIATQFDSCDYDACRAMARGRPHRCALPNRHLISLSRRARAVGSRLVSTSQSFPGPIVRSCYKAESSDPAGLFFCEGCFEIRKRTSFTVSMRRSVQISNSCFCEPLWLRRRSDQLRRPH